jgi:hypothetical protein
MVDAPLLDVFRGLRTLTDGSPMFAHMLEPREEAARNVRFTGPFFQEGVDPKAPVYGRVHVSKMWAEVGC